MALNLNIQNEETQAKSKAVCQELGFGTYGGACAICLEDIALQETALVKGCEHAYCVTCILRWATYVPNPTCPQCKHPFESLDLHRSLDGRIHDNLIQESVCLLLRATWFKPLVIDRLSFEDTEDFPFPYDDDYEDDLEEIYFPPSSSNIRIGNRRWGDNGYIRAGRREARPRPSNQSLGASSSAQPRKEVATGRRAKRALKRAAADKGAEKV